MSTEVNPPTPKQHFAVGTQHPAMSAGRKLSKTSPIAFSAHASRRQHGRSSSLGQVFSRMLPSRRPEKGHTLRKNIEYLDTQGKVHLQPSFIDTTAEERSSSMEDSTGNIPEMAWSSVNRIHSRGDEYKRGAMKKLIGSIRSTTYTAKAIISRSKDGSVEQTANGQVDDIDFEPFISKPLQQNEHIDIHASPIPNLRPTPAQTQTFTTTASRAANHSNEKQITGTQEVFDEKSAKRAQRRSLIESGDYLGVQGANPRTGYWDVSDITSSSIPSRMSEGDQQLLVKRAKEVAAKKAVYMKALQKQHHELASVQILRSLKKTSKLEQTNHEFKSKLKMIERRRGRWRASDNGWSSVVEPELNTLNPVHELGGNPVSELAFGDMVFPMPSAAKPVLYTGTTGNQNEYIKHPSLPSPLDSNLVGPTNKKNSYETRPIARPAVPVRSSSLRGNNGSISTTSETPSAESRQNFRPQVPVRTSSLRRSNGSTNTVIHKTTTLPSPDCLYGYDHRQQHHVTINGNEQVKTDILEVNSTAHSLQSKYLSFLDHKAKVMASPDQRENEATVTLYQSVSTNPVHSRQLLGPNPKIIVSGTQITSLKDLPPVFIKDPITARMPVSFQNPRINLPIWSPPTILATQPDQQPSCISTFTITTTGSGLPLTRFPQLGRAHHITNIIRAERPAAQFKLNWTTPRNSFLQKELPRKLQSGESQIIPANTATSSEHQLAPTRQRIAELCRTTPTEGGQIEPKIIPTSTYTSPRNQLKGRNQAESAAQTAFEQLTLGLAADFKAKPENEMTKKDLQTAVNSRLHTFAASIHSDSDVSQIATRSRVLTQQSRSKESTDAKKKQITLAVQASLRARLSGPNSASARNRLPVQQGRPQETIAAQKKQIKVAVHEGFRALFPRSGPVSMSTRSPAEDRLPIQQSLSQENTNAGKKQFELEITTRLQDILSDLKSTYMPAKPPTHDQLLVQHPEPTIVKAAAEKRTFTTAASIQRTPLDTSGSPAKEAPKPQYRPMHMWQALVATVVFAWLLVEPVFNPHSSLRTCFNQQKLSIRDIMLVLAASLFMGGALYVIVALVKLVMKPGALFVMAVILVSRVVHLSRVAQPLDIIFRILAGI